MLYQDLLLIWIHWILIIGRGWGKYLFSFFHTSLLSFFLACFVSFLLSVLSFVLSVCHIKKWDVFLEVNTSPIQHTSAGLCNRMWNLVTYLCKPLDTCTVFSFLQSTRVSPIGWKWKGEQFSFIQQKVYTKKTEWILVSQIGCNQKCLHKVKQQTRER